jgi:hypothetical protein
MRPQKGEYTRPQNRPPPPIPVYPPAKAKRLSQVVVVCILVSGWHWLCEVEDVDDVSMLLAAISWLRDLSWPATEEELWSGPPLLERKPG